MYMYVSTWWLLPSNQRFNCSRDMLRYTVHVLHCNMIDKMSKIMPGTSQSIQSLYSGRKVLQNHQILTLTVVVGVQ